MADVERCPNCKGKGHVSNVIAVLPILGWIFAIADRNNPTGITRDKCQQCKGAGFLKVSDVAFSGQR